MDAVKVVNSCSIRPRLMMLNRKFSRFWVTRNNG